jgi:putative peptidoglycan lipid II flippase
MLQIHGRFAGPAAVGVAFNFGIIVGVIIGQGSLGIEAAAWGVVLGATLQVVLQLPQFIRLLRDDGVRPAIVHPRLGALGLLALPVLGASLLQQINSFTDKLFASSLEAGRVSALNFANALGQAPRVALLLPLMTPLFPLIAKLVGEEREDEAVRAFRRVAGLLGLVAVPMMVLLAIYSHEVAQLAFQRRKCGPECVDQIGPPLLFYALGLWPSFGAYLLNRTLSAARRQRFILWTTAATVVVTIVLDLILLGPMEQSGLALAATIGVYFSVMISLVGMRDEFPGLPLRALGERQGRILVAGALCAVTALALNLVLPTDDLGSFALLVPLAAKVAAALAVYYVAARALARAELVEGVRAMRSLVGRGGAR